MLYLRGWIAKTLWSGGASLGIAIISGILSLVLAALGDRSGADAVRGVALVSLAVLALSVIALVVILAFNELHRDGSPPSRER